MGSQIDEATVGHQPPREPPPLLTAERILQLAYNGWLPVDLPNHITDRIPRLFHVSEGFFQQELESKQKHYPPSRGTECGFYVCPEEKEYLTLRYACHGDSDLEGYARPLWRDTANFLHRILCDLSRAAGYDTAIWDPLVKGSLTMPMTEDSIDCITTLIRIFQYYPNSGTASEHVDNGLLTLCIGDGQGLQMLDLSQTPPQWVDAKGPVVLVGDLARALLQSRVRAGFHRVVSNPSGRRSLVFALRPCLQGTVDLSTFGGNGVVNIREYYLSIKGKKTNVNATKDIREQQEKERRSHKTLAKAAAGGIASG